MRQFPGSKVDCMKDYLKPCIRDNNPDDLIFDVGANIVPSNKKNKKYGRVNRVVGKESEGK